MRVPVLASSQPPPQPQQLPEQLPEQPTPSASMCMPVLASSQPPLAPQQLPDSPSKKIDRKLEQLDMDAVFMSIASDMGETLPPRSRTANPRTIQAGGIVVILRLCCTCSIRQFVNFGASARCEAFLFAQAVCQALF